MGLPWRLKVSNLVTKQNVVFDMPVKGCITRDNVTVEIDVAIVFRIMGDKTKARENMRRHMSTLFMRYNDKIEPSLLFSMCVIHALIFSSAPQRPILPL